MSPTACEELNLASSRAGELRVEARNDSSPSGRLRSGP